MESMGPRVHPLGNFHASFVSGIAGLASLLLGLSVLRGDHEPKDTAGSRMLMFALSRESRRS